MLLLSKKRVQVCAPAQTKIEKQQNVLQNTANLCKVRLLTTFDEFWCEDAEAELKTHGQDVN